MFNVTDYSNKDVVLKAGFVARYGLYLSVPKRLLAWKSMRKYTIKTLLFKMVKISILPFPTLKKCNFIDEYCMP